MLPDRQIIYLLEYLKDGLNADKYASRWFDTAQELVSITLARNPKKPVVYKDDWMWEVFSEQFPYLALWRNSNKPDRSGTFTRTSASCGIGWFAEIPGAGDEHDGDTWGRTFASNVWHAVKELLEDIPTATLEKAGIEAVWLGEGDVDIDSTETVCGFIAPMTIDHTVPPYAIDDVPALTEVLVHIKLYDSSQVDVDGKQGKYLGLTTEADLDPST